MKKIVGIFAAAAVLATSVFAADVSAATKIKGNVFKYADDTFSMLQQNNDSHDYANPNLVFNISDDRAGAKIILTTDGNTKNVAQTTQTIWFKPVDALKISVGTYDLALNKEQIKWTESVTGLGGNGYVLSVNASGFGLDVFFNEGANGDFWLAKGKEGDPAIKEFGVKAAYGADFGTIGAFVDINRIRINWTGHDNLFGVPKGDGTYTSMYDLKAGAVQNILFGAGYRNNFNGIDVFCNVAGYMANTFEWIRPELYVAGNADAFGYALFVAPVIWTNSDLNQALGCEVVAKLSYAMDGITPYVQFVDSDVLAKTFTSTIEVGATGSVGLMGWKIWAEINTGASTTFAVPFELTASF